MEKLSMCRICLVENVRMFVVANKHLQEIYETLTDIPLVTEDRRPVLACYLCYAKLKQSYRFKRKCLEAEELFAQMLTSCELRPFTRRGNSESVGGLVKTLMENISIVDEGLRVSGPIEVEVPAVPAVPAVRDNQYEFIEVKVEHYSDELEHANVDDSYPEDVPAQHAISDSEDDVPLLKIKTEVEDVEIEAPRQPVSGNKRSASDTKRAPVAKKPIHLDDTSSSKLKKIAKSDTKIIRTTEIRTSKPVTKSKELFSSTQPAINNSIQTTITNLINSAIDSNFCSKTVIKSLEKKHTEGIKLNKRHKLSTKEKLFKCDICQRSFNEKANLRRHILGHIGKQPFKCELCPRTFNAKCHLDKHFRKHSGEKPYKCEVCQRCFSEKSNLTKHIRRHTGDKPYKCDICQRSFNQKFHLTSHSLLHTGEKPYKCEVCQQSFNRLYNFKQHYRTHTGEKPHNCDVCQRSFSHKTSLTNHLRRHTGEKPFKCVTCQRSFTHKQSLDMHIRKHTGEKPYKCEHCQRCFTQSSHLKQHYRTHRPAQ